MGYYKLSRFLFYIICSLCFPLIIYHFVWLIIHWKVYTIHQIDQVVLYSILVRMIIIHASVFQMQHIQYKEMIYVLNQAYHFGASHEIFCGPLVISYCPLQLILRTTFIAKSIEAFCDSVAVAHGGINVVSIFIFFIVLLENTIVYSSNMYPKSTCFRNCKSPVSFSNCCKRFQSLRIVLNLVNLVDFYFQTVIIFVGIILASCCSYMTIKMYGKIPLFYFMMMPCLAIMGIKIAIIQTYLESIPYKNTQKFKTFWKYQLKRKEDKKMLRACKPFGFCLGLYGIATAQHGLYICDDIIRNTVSIILLGT